jgi:hypothetical protein
MAYPVSFATFNNGIIVDAAYWTGEYLEFNGYYASTSGIYYGTLGEAGWNTTFRASVTMEDGATEVIIASRNGNSVGCAIPEYSESTGDTIDFNHYSLEKIVLNDVVNEKPAKYGVSYRVGSDFVYMGNDSWAYITALAADSAGRALYVAVSYYDYNQSYNKQFGKIIKISFKDENGKVPLCDPESQRMPQAEEVANIPSNIENLAYIPAENGRPADQLCYSIASSTKRVECVVISE